MAEASDGNIPDDQLHEADTPWLRAEIVRLRNAIRKHRDCSGHDLCWYHPELWSVLPEGYNPKPEVPPPCEFLEKCIAYRKSLEKKADDGSVKAKLEKLGKELVEIAKGTRYLKVETKSDGYGHYSVSIKEYSPDNPEPKPGESQQKTSC